MNIKSLITVSALGVLLSACGSEPEQPPLDNSNPINVDSNDNTNKADTIGNAEPWNGSALGYVHNSASKDDRVEFFIRLGRLLSAASAYRHYAGEMGSMNAPDSEAAIAAGHAYLATLFSQPLLASYSEVAPMVQAYNKDNNTALNIQSTLTDLNDPRQIVDVSRGGRSKRDQQYAANQKVQLVSSRIRDTVIAFFPSRHEYLLASSALIREAGDKAAEAVSADGVILKPNQLLEAYALIDQTVKLDPKNVAYCDAQRLPMRAHKDAINELLSKMVPNRLGEKLAVTASDIYDLADKAHAAGKRFPIIDSQRC